jgi:D-alanyl-D-alanine dipeptidase
MTRAATLAMLLALALPAQARKLKLPKTTRQLVVVVTPSWTATSGRLARFERAGSSWKPVGEPLDVTVGKMGLGWGYGLSDDFALERQGPLKGEGDGRAPAGVFKLSGIWGYAEKPPAGATLPYAQSTARSVCVDDPKSKLYNQIVDEPAFGKAWTSAQPMRRSDAALTWAVRVDHNARPVVAGQGACVFLVAHAGEPAPTVGSTAMPLAALEPLVAWLSASAEPLLVQLPESEYQALIRDLKLPAL